MLKRRILDTLKTWKETPGHAPLVIAGIRQCGKTYISQQFAQENYKHVAYINFIKQEERKTAFYGSKDVDAIILNLSAQMRGTQFVPGETCIILDEIQDCPEARTALKFFKEDGRYDVIATGSLLGVQGYGQETKKGRVRNGHETNGSSVPVGYEQIVEMYPLDFEEFLWANGMGTDVIDALKRCMEEATPVPDGIHVAMKTLLNRYIAVGGLPAAVNALLETNNMNAVDSVWKSILREYRSDMVKYASDKDKPYIRACFNAVPKMLAKENKKYQYTKVEGGGRGEYYKGSLQWLEDADIIRRCYNTSITGLPLEGNAIENNFKVYAADIGLLVAMLGPAARVDILQGNLGGFKGAIYENLMADTLTKKGQSLYFFQKESGLELDFLVRYKGECVPMEVKARSARAKSIATVRKHPEKYGVRHFIKFGDYNIGRDGDLLTLPNYMQFLLDLAPEDVELEAINMAALSRIARERLQ
ncbi:MAG: ATP-binding protein [Bacteroidales bacterium]|nr:ATP-binding protein [Bacteroidales bacterium]MBQ9588025.1 ATP-binding protein [Bacteroidales bacterium]